MVNMRNCAAVVFKSERYQSAKNNDISKTKTRCLQSLYFVDK